MAKFEIKYKAKPQVQVWYSSADKKFLKFLADLDDYLIDVEDHLDWEPRFPTYSCPECQTNYKHENCLGDGRYCVMETFPKERRFQAKADSNGESEAALHAEAYGQAQNAA